ncbi:MAG: WD40/YVTN/BNR-like repeat-containing protein, partial [Panacagrimonas sp.]
MRPAIWTGRRDDAAAGGAVMAQVRARNGRIGQAGFMTAWPAYFVTVLVAVAAVYSFAPRAYPPAPATQVHPQDLLVTQLAHRGSRWLSAGEQGRILVAENAEGPWTEARVEPQRASNFNDVLFVSDQVALAAGHESWIVRSEDGGRSWKEVLFDAERSEPILALAGPYDGTLFAIGGFGQFLTSTDEGRSWQRATFDAMSDYHLNDMTRLTDGTLMIVGER